MRSPGPPRAAIPAVVLVAAALLAGGARAAPRVVASVKPVHSLAAAVMRDVAAPELLLAGGQSPHTHTLAPSDAAALTRADLVIWVGPALESFLARPVANLVAPDARLRLTGLDAVRLLRTRAGGVWANGGHGGEGDAHDEGADAGGRRIDPHVWLDPDNAVAIVAAIADRLERIDPANADTYAANAAAARERIRAAAAEVADMIAPVRDVPFAVFHDAYHYLERHYRLNAVGGITLSPDRRPSAQRLHAIRSALRERNAACVFREPQFAPDTVRTVVDGTSVRVGVLDPLGADLAPGPGLYPALLRDLGRSLRDCLGGEA